MSDLSPASAINLALRVTTGCGVVAGLFYWGIHTGDTTPEKAALGLLAPALGFGVWGTIDFRRAGRMAEAFRLVEELLISGLAALALVAAGQRALGLALGAVTLAHHALVYVIGERLLKREPAAARDDARPLAQRPSGPVRDAR